MKLCFFNNNFLGFIRDDRVIDLSNEVRGVNAPTSQDLINAVIVDFDSRYREAFTQAAKNAQGVPVSSVRLRSPLPRPGKLVCMAQNYLESGYLKEPKAINAFLKSPEAIIGNGDNILLPPDEAGIFHHEAELGVVIGKPGANVKREDAFDHIFGYLNFIDASARALHPNSFFWGKSFDTFAPCGPYLVTKDEVPDPYALQVRMWVNGQARHDFPVSDMGHRIDRCIEWTSKTTLLEPGDIVSTGTNHQGIGPIQDGNKVEMEITGLGRLTVNVKDAKHRVWPHEVDKQMGDFIAGRAGPPVWSHT